MNFTCVASDLDGTLLDSAKRISERTKRILSQLDRAGIVFLPATGRPFSAIPGEVLTLPGVRYVVCSNGVAVYDAASGRPVYVRHLPADFVPRLLDAMKGEDVAYECMHEGRAYIAADVYERLSQLHENETIARYFRTTRTPLPDLEGFMRAHAGEFEAVDLRLDPARQETLRARIEAECPRVYITTSDPGRLEISHPDSGKHHGVARACALLGVEREALVAFGDNDNDAEMLDFAGLGVAVDNASAKCKAAADRICPANDEDGVAQALSALFSDRLPAGLR